VTVGKAPKNQENDCDVTATVTSTLTTYTYTLVQSSTLTQNVGTLTITDYHPAGHYHIDTVTTTVFAGTLTDTLTTTSISISTSFSTTTTTTTTTSISTDTVSTTDTTTDIEFSTITDTVTDTTTSTSISTSVSTSLATTTDTTTATDYSTTTDLATTTTTSISVSTLSTATVTVSPTYAVNVLDFSVLEILGLELGRNFPILTVYDFFTWTNFRVRNANSCFPTHLFAEIQSVSGHFDLYSIIFVGLPGNVHVTCTGIRGGVTIFTQVVSTPGLATLNFLNVDTVQFNFISTAVSLSSISVSYLP